MYVLHFPLGPILRDAFPVFSHSQLFVPNLSTALIDADMHFWFPVLLRKVNNSRGVPLTVQLGTFDGE